MFCFEAIKNSASTTVIQIHRRLHYIEVGYLHRKSVARNGGSSEDGTSYSASLASSSSSMIGECIGGIGSPSPLVEMGSGSGRMKSQEFLRHTIDEGPDMPLGFDIGCHRQGNGE